MVAFVASCSLDIGQLSLTRGREPAVTVSDTIRLVGHSHVDGRRDVREQYPRTRDKCPRLTVTVPSHNC